MPRWEDGQSLEWCDDCQLRRTDPVHLERCEDVAEFYANTWHTTREGALKCPVCKAKVSKPPEYVPATVPMPSPGAWGLASLDTRKAGATAELQRQLSLKQWHAQQGYHQQLDAMKAQAGLYDQLMGSIGSIEWNGRAK